MMMYADHNFRFYANGIIATDEMISKNPDLVRRFTEAIVEGINYSFAHPDESCTLLRKHAPSVDQDVCVAELALVKDLAMTDESKQTVLATCPKPAYRTRSTCSANTWV